MRFESHYTGTSGAWSNARLHRTLKVSFALNPDSPWDAGANACIIRIQRALVLGGVDDHVMSLERGPSPTSAAIGPGTPNSTVTNGVCSVNRQNTYMSANFLADSTKAWLDIYIRFNAASAPRYLFYNLDTFNNTSSGTVLMKETPFPVNP